MDDSSTYPVWKPKKEAMGCQKCKMNPRKPKILVSGRDLLERKLTAVLG